MTERDLTFETVTSPEAFAELREQWNELARAAADTVFLTHAWLSNWLAFLGDGRQPHVLLARDGQQLVAALPLSLRTRVPGIRTLEFMGSGTLTPNHLDVLALPASRQAALAGFRERLLEDGTSWDVLDLDKLPEDSETATSLLEAFSASGLAATLSTSAVCPYAQLPASYDEFFAALSKSARRHTRERIRCIEREHPDARFGVVENERDLEAALEALVRLHQQRWRSRGYAGSFADERVVGFHESMSRDALREGFLRFYTLTDRDEVAAAVLCYRMNGSVQAYSCAFEPSWSHYRPGMVLGAYAIEQSIAEGASRYDHLEGDEAHKSTWAGHQRLNLRLHVFANTLRGRLARAGVRAHEDAVAAARRFLPADVRERVARTLDHVRASAS